MGSRQIELYVNDASIEIDYFVEGFIDHIMDGIIGALKGTRPIKDLDILIDGNKANIELNGSVVPLNAFANKIVKDTVVGMVTSLKGVGDVKKVHIIIRRQL
jgi:hypothetical protein